MAVRDPVAPGSPVLGKEETQVAGRRIDDAQEHGVHDFQERGLQARVRPEGQEARIGLHDVEVRVLRLGLVQVDCGKAHVGNRLPAPAERLQVAAMAGPGVLFDQAVDGDRLVQGIALDGGAMVLREGVERESLAVDLLAVAKDGAIGRDGPVESPVHPVVEPGHEVAVGVIGHGEVVGVTVHRVGRSIGPEDA